MKFGKKKPQKMTNNELQTMAIEMITTITDKSVLMDSLAVIQDLAYTKDSAKIEQKLNKFLPEKYSPLIEVILEEVKSPAELIKTVSNLQNFIGKLPIAHLTIGYTPTREQIEQLATRIKSALGTQTLVDYSVNTNFSLGIQVDFKGKSYQKSIENSFIS